MLARTIVPPFSPLLDAEVAVQRGHPVRQSPQARAVRVGATASVVEDLDGEQAVALGDADADALGLRVLGDVGERLGDEEVGGGLDAGAGRWSISAVSSTGTGALRRERLEGGDEPAVSQQAGVNAAGELAQLGRRLLELRGGLVQTARPPRPGPPRPLSARA